MSDGAIRLLFVCSGNICRSPMAEGLAQAWGDTRGVRIVARSAGTLNIEGREADPSAVAVCREVGVDISAHRSQGVTAELIREADFVLVMELHHAEEVRERFPEVGERLYMLGSFGGMVGIDDPIGGWKFRFRRARDEISRCVDAFLMRVATRR